MKAKFFIHLSLAFLSLCITATAQMPPVQEKIEMQGDLKLGAPQQRTLAPGAIHEWRMVLEKGQLVVVEVMEKTINVAIQIVDFAGVLKGEFNNPIEDWEIEKAAWIAETSGIWQVKIVSVVAGQTGNYNVKWLTQREATPTDRRTVQADSLNNLAHRYREQNKHAEARPLYEQGFKIRASLHGPNHPEVAASLIFLGDNSANLRRYAEADSLFKEVLTLREKWLGLDHPSVAYALGALAVLRYEQGKYAEAEKFYRRALAIREKALAPDHLLIAVCLNDLGLICYKQSKYAEAEPLYHRALAIREKALGAEHPDVAVSLNNLALLYLTQGKGVEARPLFLRSLAIREKTVGPDHPMVATLLINLAFLSKPAEAVAFNKRAAAIREKALGPDHPAVLIPLNNLAAFYNNLENAAKAESLYKRIWAINEKNKRLNHPQFATTLHNLAALYRLQGKYLEAEPLYLRALGIKEKALGPEHPEVATNLNSLAKLYVNQGKYAEAEPLYRRTLAILEKKFDANHHYVGINLNNIALLQTHLGKFAAAESLFTRALAILEKGRDRSNRIVAEVYNNLAQLHLAQGKYAQARALFEKNLEIYAKQYTTMNLAIASSLINLADTILKQEPSKLDTSLILLEQSLNILQAQSDWPVERMYAGVYALRAQIRRQKGDKEGAIADLAQAIHSAERFRPLIGRGEDTRVGYFAKFAKLFDQIVTWELQAGQVQEAFAYSEQSRAGALSQAIREAEGRTFSGIPDSLLQTERWLRNQIALIETEIQKVSSEDSPQDSLMIKNLESRFPSLIADHNELLKAFEKNYPRYYDLKYQTRAVSVPELQKNLAPNVALLEYFAGDSVLHIFAVTKDQFEVISQPKDSSFVKLVESFYSAVRKADTPQYLSSAPALYKLLIAPVEKQIASQGKLVIIPHNILYKVPFEALLKTPDQFKGQSVDYRRLDYLLKHFDISYHYSATLYAKSLQERVADNVVTANSFMGFAPVFRDKDKTGYTLASRGLPLWREENDETMRAIVVDGRKFGELKYSEGEIKSIVTLFSKKARDQKSIGYFHGQATEQNFKANVKNYRYVHIATHSFINQDKPALSGIIFAQPTDSTASEDGVLYAAETYNLELAADLMVLSSCESGLGKLIQGEGMMAMTRGFLYSGAANLIFSLWKVPDQQTRDLMVAFYQQMLAGKSYAQALRQAKLKMISNRLTAVPRLWSSFVLIGAD